MRNYELMLIIRPTLDATATAEEAEKVAELLKTSGGDLAKVSNWGRRKLAYAINDQMEGTYVLYHVALAPDALHDIEFSLKLNENILRYLIVKSNGIVESDEAPAPIVEGEAEVTPETAETTPEAAVEATPVAEAPAAAEEAPVEDVVAESEVEPEPASDEPGSDEATE